MVSTKRLSFACFFLVALFLASACIALGTTDPELKQCKHQCRVQQQFDEEKRSQCVAECKRYSEEKRRREGEKYREEMERREREKREGGGTAGSESDDDFDNPKSPWERLRDCEEWCQSSRREGREREHCSDRCRREYERERGREEPADPQKEYRRCQERCEREAEGGYSHPRQCQQRCEEDYRKGRGGRGWREGDRPLVEDANEEGMKKQGRQEEIEQNPYLFEEQHFKTRIQTQHGRVTVLDKFTKRSNLFRGIENYRLAILEAAPQTFIVPNHWDAEAVFFVAKGKGTVSLIREEKRESINVRYGDVLRIPAGTTSYLINRDNSESLVILKLLIPVSTPGHFETFFGAGGQNPESFYRAFSTEILEAALNTRRDRVERLFGQQMQGAIVKASEEQIRAMSRHEEGGIWPFGGESKGSFNLFQQRPTTSNQYGQLFEVNPDEYRQLQDLDVGVTFANISRGAMSAPMYNSRVTKIAVVTEGEGYVEMACPHLSSQSKRGWQQETEGSRTGEARTGSGTSYQKVSGRLKRRTVMVIPAGHPFVTVASNSQNLQVVCFEIKARNNQKFPLAGRRSVINQIEREAKELAFGVPAREVEEVFRSQQEEGFFRGPRQQQQGRADA